MMGTKTLRQKAKVAGRVLSSVGKIGRCSGSGRARRLGLARVRKRLVIEASGFADWRGPLRQCRWRCRRHVRATCRPSSRSWLARCSSTSSPGGAKNYRGSALSFSLAALPDDSSTLRALGRWRRSSNRRNNARDYSHAGHDGPPLWIYRSSQRRLKHSENIFGAKAIGAIFIEFFLYFNFFFPQRKIFQGGLLAVVWIWKTIAVGDKYVWFFNVKIGIGLNWCLGSFIGHDILTFIESK